MEQKDSGYQLTFPFILPNQPLLIRDNHRF